MRDSSESAVSDAIDQIGAMQGLRGQISSTEIALIVLALRSDLDVVAPAKVANLKATVQGARAASLNWLAATDNAGGSGISHYLIYYQPGDPIQVDASLTEFYLPALSPSTPYRFAISAVDKAGNEGERSDEVSIETNAEPVVPDTRPPSVPGDFAASLVGTSRAELRWSASQDEPNGSGLRGYKIFQGTAEIAAVNAGTHRYEAVNLAAGMSHAYTVKAVDNANNLSAPTPTVTIQIPSASGVTLYSQSCQGCHGPLGTSDVRGSPSSAIQGAIETRAAMRNLSSLSRDEIAAIAGVLANTPDTTPPSAPRSVVATALTFSSVRLTWSASSDQGGSGIKGYTLWRNNSVLIANLSPNADNYLDSGLLASTNYQYQVGAVDNAGNVSAPASISVKTPEKPAALDLTPPSVPKGLVLVSSGTNQISMRWSASADSGVGVSDYFIYRNGAFLAATTATSYVDRSVISDTSYTFSVKARDGASNVSALSVPITVKTLEPNGIELYQAKRCVNCHNGLSNSSLKYIATTLNGFENLYNAATAPLSDGGIAQMQGLNLRPVEVRAIGKLLIGEEPTEEDPKIPLPVSGAAVVGTRSRLSSFALQLFTNPKGSSTEDAPIQNIINRFNTAAALSLGGSCTRYDASCAQTARTHDYFATLRPSPLTDVSRLGILINSCAQLLELHTAVENSLARAALNPASDGNATNIRKLLAVYFPGRIIPTSVVNSFVELFAAAAKSGMSGPDSWRAWRLVQLPACEWALGGGL